MPAGTKRDLTAATNEAAGAKALQKPEPWLIVIDPQNIFASEDSEWGSPYFAEAFSNIKRLAVGFGDRVLVTRWLPSADRGDEHSPTSWADYFRAWPFADVSAEHELYDLVPAAKELSRHATIDEPSFGKWGKQLKAVVGAGAQLVVTGVSTDCCVISTVLSAADAGCWIKVAVDAVAPSTVENGEAALKVMGLYAPQVQLSTTDEILSEI